MGNAHRVAGMASWLAAAPFLHVTERWQIAVGTLIAGATAHGRMSPDVDRYVFGGKRLGSHHRRLPHWWPIPLLAFAAVVQLVPGQWQWAGLAVAVAWASHIAADFVFGRVPIWWWCRWRTAGIGLRTGGAAEHAAYPLLIGAAAWLAWTTL